MRNLTTTTCALWLVVAVPLSSAAAFPPTATVFFLVARFLHTSDTGRFLHASYFSPILVVGYYFNNYFNQLFGGNLKQLQNSSWKTTAFAPTAWVIIKHIISSVLEGRVTILFSEF